MVCAYDVVSFFIFNENFIKYWDKLGLRNVDTHGSEMSITHEKSLETAFKSYSQKQLDFHKFLLRVQKKEKKEIQFIIFTENIVQVVSNS